LLSEFDKLISALKNDTLVQDEKTPIDISNEQVSIFLPILGIDACPWFDCSNLGKIDTDVNKYYKKGERVVVLFTGGNPRVNFRHISNYLNVQRKVGSNWVNFRSDNDWDTT